MSQLSIELYSMKRVEQDVLREQKVFLIKNVVPDIHFLAECTASKVFSRHFVEDHLQSLTSHSDKVAKILEYVPKRGPEAFSKFVAALEKTEQHHVADRLKQKVEEKARLQKHDDPICSALSTPEPHVEGVSEIPMVIKGKFVDVYEKVRQLLLTEDENDNDRFEEHNINTIKFDYVDEVVTALLKSYTWLYEFMCHCKNELEEAGLHLDVQEGIDFVFNAWNEKKQETIDLKKNLEKACKESKDYFREAGVLEYEVKLLKERESKHLSEKQDMESEINTLRRKVEELENKEQELQSLLVERERQIKSHENAYHFQHSDTTPLNVNVNLKEKDSILRRVTPRQGMLNRTVENPLVVNEELLILPQKNGQVPQRTLKTSVDNDKGSSDFIKIFGQRRGYTGDSCNVKDQQRQVREMAFSKQTGKDQFALKRRPDQTSSGFYVGDGSMPPNSKIKNRDTKKSIRSQSQTTSFVTKGSPFKFKILRD